MWALRRASAPLRSRALNLGPSRACRDKLTLTTCIEDEDVAGFRKFPQIIPSSRDISLKTFHHNGHSSLNFFLSRHELSSLAGSTSYKQSKRNYQGEIINGKDDIEILSRRITAKSELFKAIVNAPGSSVHHALEKWVEEGKELSREEISLAMTDFRRSWVYEIATTTTRTTIKAFSHWMCEKALQLSEWVEANKLIDMAEEDYKHRLDLIAKVHGVHKAKMYIEGIPEAFRGETMYTTLLINCVIQRNVRVAEEVFKKMNDLGLPVTAFVCDQLLILYLRTDKKKIANILSVMKKENVQPSLLTYNILIDARGFYYEIDEIEKIVGRMKAEGVEPNIQINLSLARHYASAGFKEKAEAVLKEIEGENLEKNRWFYRFLLPIYANIGKSDKVERIWAVLKSDHPRANECFAAIEAWGKLNKIEEAEAVFEMLLNKWEKLSSKQYASMLRVYASQKMLTKGKDLVRRMTNSGCGLCPFSLDAIVKLFVNSGEARKAESVIHKAIQGYHAKPKHGTYLIILNEYASRGDVHGAERVFYNMRPHGYTSRSNTFLALIQAYINAKRPAYGIRERIKSDNVIPSRHLSNKLAQVDAFDTQSPVLDLIAHLQFLVFFKKGCVMCRVP